MMTSYSSKIKERLTSIIQDMSTDLTNFVKDPKTDFTRTRKLSFPIMLDFILSMNGNSLSTEILEYKDYTEKFISTSAFVQQRDKIKPEAFQYLFKSFTQTYDKFTLYQGYNLLAVDGSNLDIAHNPIDDLTYIKGANEGKGHNALHLNALYDLKNKLYVDATIQYKRKTHEREALFDMVRESTISDSTILIADRGYESYNTFAHIERKGWKYLIRVKDIHSKSITSTLLLPNTDEFDEQIQLILTRKQTNEVKQNPNTFKFLPNNARFDFFKEDNVEYYPMTFRVARFKLTDSTYETVITNLDSEEFTSQDLKEMYHMRWGIETSFRELKYALGLLHFHAKKVSSILQEVFAKLTMYNFCSMIMMNVEIKPKKRAHHYQINYTLAITCCRKFFKTPTILVENLIAEHILPVRPGRNDKRNLKHKSCAHFIYRVK